MSTSLDEAIFGPPTSGGAPGSGSGAPRPPRRGALARRWATILTAVAVFGGGSAFTYGLIRPVYDSLTAPKDYTGTGSTAVTFSVKNGDSGSVIAENLAKAGIIRSAGAFVDALSDTEGAEIQAGSYSLKKEMSAASALSALRDGKHRNIFKVVIREGLWKSEVFAALSKATKVPVASYVAAAKNAKAVGLPADAKGNIEGYLFPATYEFQPGDSATSQLKTMVSTALANFGQIGITPAKRQRTLIIASIVENEARKTVDRPKVARVIENRLAKNIRLELDSTVSYGVQKRAITTTDEERAKVNGYGTYKHDGLPIGPIGNPGIAALRAAMSPTPGKWLFFVAVNPDTGETRYAVTPAEHDANVRLFQKWCSANPGKC